MDIKSRMVLKKISSSNIFYNVISLFLCFAVIITACGYDAVYAAMISCQHCSKKVDNNNATCPYCLGDLSVPAVSVPAPAEGNDASANAVNKKTRHAKPAARKQVTSKIVTENELKTYLEESILKAFHNNNAGQTITLDSFKRDMSIGEKFSIGGKAYNKTNRPLYTVGKFIERLNESSALTQVNLNHAAKIDINDPTLVTFTITFKVEPASSEFKIASSKSKPLDFTFVVPPSAVESVNVKILKIYADSESTLYNMMNKSGDKVTLNLIPEGGMKILVLIDGKVVYDKNY